MTKPEPKATDEPLARREKATDEPLARREKATDEPLARREKATDEPLARREKATDEPRRKQLVASFDNYLGAQSLVDRMSDGGFPVEHVSIVGDELRTIEVVTGRMTTWKAAGAGAASGA